jgi:hypothetical protein
MKLKGHSISPRKYLNISVLGFAINNLNIFSIGAVEMAQSQG